MEITERNSFIMYKSYRELLDRLPAAQRGNIITAVYQYLYDGEVSESLSPIAAVVFSVIKSNLDRDTDLYIDKCRKNSENGKKGGRPKLSGGNRAGATEIREEKSERFFGKPKKADNDNDNGNDNDNDNVNGNGDDNDNERAAAADAMTYQRAPHTAERKEKNFGKAVLRGEDKLMIMEEGIPCYYIDQRLDRACFFAQKQGMSVVDVFRAWWAEDQKRSGESNEEKGGSFDTDDFFAAAVRRTQEEFKRRFGDD